MATDETRPVGQQIRLARKEKGLTVKELASSSGCSDEYLEWVEDGQVEPPVALLIQLARALKLDPSAFLKVDDGPDRRLKEAAKRTEHDSYKTLTSPASDSHLMAFRSPYRQRRLTKG